MKSQPPTPIAATIKELKSGYYVVFNTREQDVYGSLDEAFAAIIAYFERSHETR